ncbi:MAG: FtsX-like permease family protein [Gemmataceae bacterium]
MSSFRLALTNLLHDRGRTLVSVTGATFAVILVFMQLGFLGSVVKTATMLFDKLEFDLVVVSSEYIDFTRPGAVRRDRLAQVRTDPAVAAVVPLSVSQGLWRNPTDDKSRGRKRWQITVLGTDPGRLDRAFRAGATNIFGTPAAVADARVKLARGGAVLLDRRSRPDFGDPARMPAGKTSTELSGQRVDLAGYFELGTGFSYSGLVLASEETFESVSGQPADRATFGLVKLADGEDPDAAARRLRAALPADVKVFTRPQINFLETDYWVNKTAVGTLFMSGVVLALVVGAIFIYQMMVADIKKHLPEYATLKAVGYPFRYLFLVVVWQAVFLAAAGYLIGAAAAFGLYRVAKEQAKIPIEMTPERLGYVLLLTVGMCVGSGPHAVRKVRTADPADLF